MRRRTALHAIASLLLPSMVGSTACRSRGDRNDESGTVRLVLKYQPLGEARRFHSLLRDFEDRHPGVTIAAEALPSASDVAHQYLLTALEGGPSEIDLFIVDVAWVAEFARAGWLLDVSDVFSPADIRRDFLANAATPVIIDDRTVAVPWYVDTGLLYYRTDLVPHAPRTYDDLVLFADRARRDHADLAGFVWQGRQYEGLVCNVYEAIWGHGGTPENAAHVGLRTDNARQGLRYLRSLVTRGTSPRFVTSASEEETRRAFQSGRAVFMRNWPYAFAEAERPGSPIRHRSAIAPLPSLRGDAGAGVLGGYELAVSRQITASKRDIALSLLAHLTSHESNLALATAYGRNPARRLVYEDERMKKGAPLTARLLPLLERARPRPITPYYAMISDILQGEFSAAIAGIREVDDALERAEKSIRRVTGAT